MIELALSIAAFLFLAWLVYIAVIIAAWIVIFAVGTAIQVVLWPFTVMWTFFDNLRRHRP